MIFFYCDISLLSNGDDTGEESRMIELFFIRHCELSFFRLCVILGRNGGVSENKR